MQLSCVIRHPAAANGRYREKPRRFFWFLPLLPFPPLVPLLVVYCAAIADCAPRSTNFWIFPVAVFGSSVTKVNVCGHLKCARRSRVNGAQLLGRGGGAAA